MRMLIVLFLFITSGFAAQAEPSRLSVLEARQFFGGDGETQGQNYLSQDGFTEVARTKQGKTEVYEFRATRPPSSAAPGGIFNQISTVKIEITAASATITVTHAGATAKLQAVCDSNPVSFWCRAEKEIGTNSWWTFYTFVGRNQ